MYRIHHVYSAIIPMVKYRGKGSIFRRNILIQSAIILSAGISRDTKTPLETKI